MSAIDRAIIQHGASPTPRPYTHMYTLNAVTFRFFFNLCNNNASVFQPKCRFDKRREKKERKKRDSGNFLEGLPSLKSIPLRVGWASYPSQTWINGTDGQTYTHTRAFLPQPPPPPLPFAVQTPASAQAVSVRKVCELQQRSPVKSISLLCERAPLLLLSVSYNFFLPSLCRSFASSLQRKTPPGKISHFPLEIQAFAYKCFIPLIIFEAFVKIFRLFAADIFKQLSERADVEISRRWGLFLGLGDL